MTNSRNARKFLLIICAVFAVLFTALAVFGGLADTSVTASAASYNRGYSSADEAAYAWAQKYAAASIRENREYGSTIYINSYGRYDFTTANRGTRNSVDPSTPSRYYKWVALIHSHGKAEWDKGEEFFSGADYSYTLSMGLDTIYVTTPEGKLKRGTAYGAKYHDSWWGNAFAAFTTPFTTKTVRSDLPHDRSALGQKILFKHWGKKRCSKCA